MPGVQAQAVSMGGDVQSRLLPHLRVSGELLTQDRYGGAEDRGAGVEPDVNDR